MGSFGNYNSLRGEIEWTIDADIEELNKLLATGKYIWIGEGSLNQQVRMQAILRIISMVRNFVSVTRNEHGANGKNNGLVQKT